MATVTANTILKTQLNSLDEVYSLITDDGTTMKYNAVPLMPDISAMLASNTGTLAAGSTTFVDSGLTISLPVGTFYIEMFARLNIFDPDGDGGQLKFTKTGTIAETGTAMLDYCDDFATFPWTPLADNPSFNVAEVAPTGSTFFRVRGTTRIVVTVAGVVKVQVAQAATGGAGSGVRLMTGSYLLATRVG